MVDQGEDDATGERIEQSRIKAGGNIIGKQDDSVHYHLAPRSQADRTEEAGWAFHEAACGYRSQTKMPAFTAALIISIALAGELFDIDSGLLASGISREQLDELRAFEDPPAELTPAELRPTADDLRAVCAPLYPAADEVCRAAVGLYLALMKAAETLRKPPHPFAWCEPDEAMMKYQALEESIGRFADALSARLDAR